MNIIELIKKLFEINKNQSSSIYSIAKLFSITSCFVTPFFYYMKCSANMVSLISLIMGVIGASIVFINGIESIGYGISLLFLSILIDYCDGSIARLNNTPNFFGRFVDGLVDILVIGIFQCSLLYVFIEWDHMFSSISQNIFHELLILLIISTFSTPIQHLIFDRYSSYTRWIKEKNPINISPTLKHEISFVYIDLINDIQLILLLVIPFFIDVIIIYFIINLLTSCYLIYLHLFFSRKYMNIHAECHRKKK